MKAKDPLLNDLLSKALPSEQVSDQFTKNVLNALDAAPEFEIAPLISRRSWRRLIWITSVILSIPIILSAHLPVITIDFPSEQISTLMAENKRYFAILILTAVSILADEFWRKKKVVSKTTS